jgi:hypothetical protein
MTRRTPHAKYMRRRLVCGAANGWTVLAQSSVQPRERRSSRSVSPEARGRAWPRGIATRCEGPPKPALPWAVMNARTEFSSPTWEEVGSGRLAAGR